MIHCRVTCNLEAQCKKKDLQSSPRHWRQHNTDDYIAFCTQSHCAAVSTVAKTIQASSATADKNYIPAAVPNARSKNPVHHSESVNFFRSGVIPMDVRT